MFANLVMNANNVDEECHVTTCSLSLVACVPLHLCNRLFVGKCTGSEARLGKRVQSKQSNEAYFDR